MQEGQQDMEVKMWGKAKSCRFLQAILRTLSRGNELRSLSKDYRALL